MTRVHAVLDVPAAAHARAAVFWERTLGWRLGTPWAGHPELQSFTPPDGPAYVHLQSIDGPPRVHVDLEVREAGATVDLAVGLGADQVAEHDEWVTLRSPGGLPFCVLGGSTSGIPAPVTWPDGHRSRLVQVCVDAPASRVDAEVAFWRGLLPGAWSGSDSPEFVGKWHVDGSPLQLLFQRLDEHDGDVRAHLDTGSDDLPAEVRRLVDLGARDVRPGDGWHVLTDPAGATFCVTENSPASPDHRDLG